MEVRSLRESEREECIALWTQVWPGDSDAYFRRYFEADVEWLPYYTQVAIDDGRIVSAAHICKRTVACGEFRLQMGGIANVATLPEFRGRGYSSACLRAAIAVMEADALDFSLLFTGINSHYAKQGFATIPRVRLRGALRSELPPAPEQITVRAAVAGDLEAIYEIYDVYNRNRPIAVQRSPAYWRDWIGMDYARLSGPDAPLVAQDSTGRIVGYIAVHANFYNGHQITEDYAYISEYGDSLPCSDEQRPGAAPDRAPTDRAGGSCDVAVALFRAAASKAAAGGKRELHVSVALSAAVRTAVEQICATVSENVTDSGMARLLNRDGLVRSFLMEWNERWIESGRPRGEIAFETPYGPIRLSAHGPFLAVTPLPAAAGVHPQSALLGLIFGTTRASAVGRTAEETALLEGLGSAPPGVYWSADGF